MQERCGQCRGPFTSHCTQMTPCHKHQADCFTCLKCDELSSSSDDQDHILCIVCNRKDYSKNMYYDYNCDSHICRFHLLKMDFTKAEIDLPCGHKQDSYDILMFMTSYCILCGRRLRNSKKLDQLGICIGCEKRGFESAKGSIKQSEVIKSQASKQAQIQQKQQNKGDIKVAAQPQTTRLINEIKSEMMLIKQSLKVSQFTRNQIKQAINHVQRDKDCIICLQPFNLNNKKPMMVCLQQHLLCQHCLHHQPSLNNCPLCREEIPKSKVVASRERMKTIQLQMIISEKYQTKLQKCLLAQTTVPQQPKQVIKQPQQPKKQPQPPKIEVAPKALLSEQPRKQLIQPARNFLFPRASGQIARRTAPVSMQPKRGRPPSGHHNGTKKQKQ